MNPEFQDSRDNRDRDGKPRSASFDVVLRRFFREVQQSRILSEVKKRRYRTKRTSRTIIRQSARRKAIQKRVKRGY
ncbi:MAG: 30S ribosomal protein S21 [Patescibacteria group bacterium]